MFFCRIFGYFDSLWWFWGYDHIMLIPILDCTRGTWGSWWSFWVNDQCMVFGRFEYLDEGQNANLNYPALVSLEEFISHTPLETWFWFQWTLTIPYDQGWWEHWFKLYLRWFHCKNLDLYFSTDFKRVLWKYKIIRQMIAFYYIFGFFGTFYDGWSHFCGIKIQFLT